MPPNTASNTLRELLLEGKRFLASARTPEIIASPALDAALFLAEVSGLSREELLAHDDYELDGARRARYFELLERRAGGECAAYILGRKEFWGMEFTVTSDVLVPRPDTEILVEAALGILRGAAQASSAESAAARVSAFAPATPQFPTAASSGPRRVLDLCTGSGAVAIALKQECPELEVWASDISEAALGVARNNAKNLARKITFVQGDLFEALGGSPRFTLITANAPYIPADDIPGLAIEVRNEPRLALDGGRDGLDLIRRIIAEAPRFLEAGGSLALEADPSQMETMAALLKKSGFAETALYRDLAGNNRVIAASLAAE